MFLNTVNHLIYFKVERNYIETKLHSKETFKQLIYQKLIKNWYQSDHDFFVFKNTHRNKRVKVASVFLRNSIKKNIKTTSFFLSILGPKKCIEMMPIFHSSILCRKKHVKTMLIFRPSKLRRKGTSKRRLLFSHWNYI